MKNKYVLTALFFLIGLFAIYIMPDYFRWIGDLSISELVILLLIQWVVVAAAWCFFYQTRKKIIDSLFSILLQPPNKENTLI